MNNLKKQAFCFIDEHQEEMTSLWQELVHLESGSHYKVGIDAVAERLKKILDAEGANTQIVKFEKAGNMLISKIGEHRPKKGVLFLGHMDTVFAEGTTAKRPFSIKDGRAYGPGVLDMKGGIVVLLYAIKALNAIGYDTRPLKVLLAGDEEIAHANSNASELIVKEAKGFEAAFNCETGFTDDGIVVGRKGTVLFTLEVKGVAAHAGNDPEKGRSAILEMAHKIIAIQNLTDLEEGTTYNVGVMQGGTVPNAVPDYAKVVVDVRYTDPALLPEIIKKVEELAAKTYVDGTSTTVTRNFGIAPMKTTAEVTRLFELVKKTYEENNFGHPYAKQVGGGSDSSYTILAGVPTVCAMGVKGARNHSSDEHAIVDTLFERAKLLVACVLNLDAK